MCVGLSECTGRSACTWIAKVIHRRHSVVGNRDVPDERASSLELFHQRSFAGRPLVETSVLIGHGRDSLTLGPGAVNHVALRYNYILQAPVRCIVSR